MAWRIKLLLALVLAAAAIAVAGSIRSPGKSWPLFLIYTAAVLASSGMKVSLLRSDSTMSVNFPIILLAVLELSPLQAIAIAAISVFAQCKFRVHHFFSIVQIAFNVGNAINATALCYLTYSALHQAHVEAAPALTAGAVVYFFANTVPVALIVGWTGKKQPLSLWRANFSWFLPFYLVGAGLAALAHFLSIRYGRATALLVIPAAYTIYRSYNAQIARLRDREQHMAEMEALHLRTIESLAMAIEAKDQDTHDHLLRVRVYVTALAETLKLNTAEIQAVRTAALLHDIGKLAVPERIINKPGKLSQEEFEKMKIHPVVGADILERVRFPYPVVPIVRAHHEWWNGMGYPDGLKGTEIPIGARILTVVDSFDAMASDRPYRKAMPLPDAMAVVRKMSGTQFDPAVVDALEQHYVRLEAEARLEGEKLLRLETEVKVARGTAPGAGFEQDSQDVSDEQSTSGLKARQETCSEEAAPRSELLYLVSRQLADLLTTTEMPGYALNLDETLTVLSARLAPLIPFDCLVLYLADTKNELLTPRGMDRHTASFFSPLIVPFGEGLSGWAALHEHSIVNGNPRVEPNYIAPPAAGHDLEAALSLPLRDPEGRLFGVLSLYARTANTFSRDHLQALEKLEATTTSALRNALAIRPDLPVSDSDADQRQPHPETVGTA